MDATYRAPPRSAGKAGTDRSASVFGDLVHIDSPHGARRRSHGVGVPHRIQLCGVTRDHLAHPSRIASSHEKECRTSSIGLDEPGSRSSCSGSTYDPGTIFRSHLCWSALFRLVLSVVSGRAFRDDSGLLLCVMSDSYNSRVEKPMTPAAAAPDIVVN